MNLYLNHFISKDGTEDDSNDGSGDESGDDGLATGNISVINMTSAECIQLIFHVLEK